MHIIRTTILNDSQENDILFLEKSCRESDRSRLTFPMEDGSLYFLLYDSKTLLSALSAFFDGNDSYECFAFTKPDRRQRGYFAALLEALTKETGECDLVFAADTLDPTCHAAVCALQALGAEPWYQEYMMELYLTRITAGFVKEAIAKLPSCSISPLPGQKHGFLEYRFKKDQEEIGRCRLELRGSMAYFYGFEIKENLRNQGFGTTCLALFLHLVLQLPDEKRPKRLLLQVSGSNLAAVALYKKAGFSICEQLTYYIY